MSELRERLLEAAEAAAREGRIPTAGAVVARGRRRRARLLAGTAVLVVLVVVAGMVGADRLSSRPAPLSPTPTTGPTTTTRPSGSTAPAQVWIPRSPRSRSGRSPGPTRGRTPAGSCRT